MHSNFLEAIKIKEYILNVLHFPPFLTDLLQFAPIFFVDRTQMGDIIKTD
jgi:hypothetical protein